MPDKCSHYWGFQRVDYEGGWLVGYKDDFLEGVDEEIKFSHCPLCGEELSDAP
jgi:hypothetical protein